MKTEADTVIPFSKLRKKVAERLSYSKSRIPHFYLEIETGMTEALKLRSSYNNKGDLHLSVNDLVIKAAACSLHKFERMNSHVEEDRVVVKKDINIGIAVSVDDGIIVPVIPNADLKSVGEISETSRKKIADTRRGVIDFRIPGTFTVSNLGMYGIKNFLPVINPPECGILAVGCIEKRVVYDENRKNTKVCEMMSITLACDHRGTDGAYAARFLGCLKHHLEAPEALFEGCEL